MHHSIPASSAVWIGDLTAAQVKYEKVLGPKDAIFAMNPGRSVWKWKQIWTVTHCWGGNPETKVAMVQPRVQNELYPATVQTFQEAMAYTVNRHLKRRGPSNLKTPWGFGTDENDQAWRSVVWNPAAPTKAYEVLLIQTLAMEQDKEKSCALKKWWTPQYSCHFKHIKGC